MKSRMSCNFQLWNSVNPVVVKSDIPENVLKICNINDHLYVLTVNNNLYHGIKTEDNCITLEKGESGLIDIDTCDSHLYTVSGNGEVHRRNSNLEILDEAVLLEESKTCLHGHSNVKHRLKVKKIFINKFGKLFITESGQLWGAGCMPQIGINDELPKRVTFFDGRHTYTAGIGYDFAVAVVSKQLENDDYIKDCEENTDIPNCPVCLSASLQTSPISQNSLSESCPLGIKLTNSYDIETTSTSSKNDTNSSANDSYKPVNGDTQLADECIDTDKTEKNILVRNTEIAKQFLSRKISWMSSAGEEYLAECTERPSRIIKENVTNMASFVYEGVKTVGDKVATLSRHVSASSEYNDVSEHSNGANISRSTSKDEFMWSLSQGTSEHDVSEHGLNDRIKVMLEIGSNLINSEVWTWGNIMHGQLGIYFQHFANNS